MYRKEVTITCEIFETPYIIIKKNMKFDNIDLVKSDKIIKNPMQKS